MNGENDNGARQDDAHDEDGEDVAYGDDEGVRQDEANDGEEDDGVAYDEEVYSNDTRIVG